MKQSKRIPGTAPSARISGSYVDFNGFSSYSFFLSGFMSSPSTSGRLLAEERRRKVLGLLEKQGRVTVHELTEQFGVSPVTMRADLDALSETGALVRSHGGAVRRLDPALDYPVEFKESVHHAEEVRIGQAAARLMKSGQTAILNCGTATLQVARHIRLQKLKGISVITNALHVAAELAQASNVSLIMIGGILRQLSNSFVGPQAEHMLSELHADHLFLAVEGLDLEVGPTTPDILEAQLSGRMIRISTEVTIVADASTIGKRSVAAIAGMSSIHRLITDDRVSPTAVQALTQKGVEVIVV
jgi:DeoR/GlpR family transcriptional regulator of sugar metabolism